MWDEHREATLRHLWSAGLSASQVAERLGGLTRNAVIGKVHRMGLAARSPNRKLRDTRKRSERYAAKRQERLLKMRAKARGKAKAVGQRAIMAALREGATPLPMADAPSPHPVKHDDLEPHHCRWPIGDPREPEFHFCGATKVTGLPYCTGHAVRAYDGHVRPAAKSMARPQVTYRIGAWQRKEFAV